jgi:predicted AlkP superfamily pyrophosphatase or phosphodiesterase
MTKLVLVMVDALKPAMLERAVAEGRAPAFAEILRRGTYYPDCVSVFPSVTPAAAGSITTGTMPDVHGVPSICWYHRGERRYVDYGSSAAAVRTFGVLRALNDTVYNMNFDHLNRRTLTVFEQLDDMGVRTACTPFLIFRGRTRHELGVQGWLRRVAQAANFRHAVYGPSELFYGELYSSQVVECRPTLARPGTRDPYSGCVGAHVEKHDLYDFMLFSLPDNDHHSHRFGPQSTVESIARADRHLAELAEPAGGIERFLDDHAVILMSDHAQIAVSERINLAAELSDWQVLQPNAPTTDGVELAVAPGARSAMVYVIDPDSFGARAFRRLLKRVQDTEGAEVVAWKEDEDACVWTAQGALRFRPGAAMRDLRGEGWDVEGSLETLELEQRDGRLASRTYPDALRRIWSALSCEGAGDVLVSAARGYEFTDWGGADHVGGGSHGSLRRGDSLATLAFVNCGPDLGESAGEWPEQWSIADVAPLVISHFEHRRTG